MLNNVMTIHVLLFDLGFSHLKVTSISRESQFISNLADVSSRIADVFSRVLINESLILNDFAIQNVPVASNS